MPRICKTFDARLIYVIRPIAEIETTRLRRNWAPEFGAKGAETIYAHMFRSVVEQAPPTIMVQYNELLAAPERHARMLSEFTGLRKSETAIRNAASFVVGPPAGDSRRGK